MNNKLEIAVDRKKSGRSYRVVIHGLPHFCQKLASLLDCEGWEVRYHSPSSPAGLLALASDLRRCDLAYTWGGRIDLGKFLWGARCLGPKKLVMLWSGSDALWAKKDFAARKMHPWVAAKTHWAVSPWIAEEVRSIGLQCEYVQASFVERVKKPLPMPDKFSVLAYLPSVDKAALYGWDQILQAAKSLPAVQFRIVGLQGNETLSCPPNVTTQGWTNSLTCVLQQSSVMWRPVQHDGLSFMVLESLAQGRHVLYSYPLPGCIRVNNSEAAIQELKRLASLHDSHSLGLNAEGLATVEQEFCMERVRESLLDRWERIILASETTSTSGIVGGQARDAAQSP
jgi:hypothetical protein